MRRTRIEHREPGVSLATHQLTAERVRSGSIASVRRCLRHVRSTSNNCRDDAVPRTAERCQSETLGRRLAWVPASEFVELGPPVHSPLMFAALMIGHHFSISAF